ncbi:MAG: NAD(P)/FAD-dependent oxidoreductase [Defluviitaleaceae bacterium]|nr:NAD(P)/FAD-dependent oxidoreductase [Defluviitaleaceae bacterium]MCL2275131.1 NAD(P)/FAD-dependent oxidoreductase [Defluviitaleaceae bacterium]
MKTHDVIIIGAGIIGCAAARALAKFSLTILVLEQGADVSIGASKANSGILHAGYDCKPHTQKALLNVQGLHMYKKLVDELHIPHRFNGSLVVSTVEDGAEKLRRLYKQGITNGVEGMELLTAQQVGALEPNLHPSVNGALHAKTAGIVSPYEAVIAFAESAALNGVRFKLETTVTSVDSLENGYAVQTTRGTFNARVVINCAGTESGNIANLQRELAHVPPMVIHPQRGQYYLLDNTQRGLISHTIFQLPTHMGKGVLIAPTVDYNVLLGPTAEAVDDPRRESDPNATATTRSGLQEALDKARLTLRNVPIHDRITAFAGVRAKHAQGDFIIEESPKNFIHAIGIDSPGLTAAPAIAEKLAKLALARLQPAENANFVKERPPIARFRDLSPAEQQRLIAFNPAYGNIVCRCETITQGEIQDALKRFAALQAGKLTPASLDALKRRTRAQMGRCQGGFCTLRLIELIAREYKIPEGAVTKNGTQSEVTA